MSSADTRQLANIAEQAPFDGVNSFGTDAAFKGSLAYVGNYDNGYIYPSDIQRSLDVLKITDSKVAGAGVAE